MQPQNQTMCPKCKGNISPLDIFCPICGNRVKEKTVSTSVLTQILIYLFSILLAPLGIIPAIKYLKQQDQKARNIGIVAIILTIASVIVISWITIDVINTFKSTYGNQLSILGIGY